MWRSPVLRWLCVKKALRDHQVKLVLGSRHGDIEKPPFFLNFRCRAGSKIGRQASIDGTEKEIPRRPRIGFADRISERQPDPSFFVCSLRYAGDKPVEPRPILV
jgi:hypothetical protein